MRLHVRAPGFDSRARNFLAVLFCSFFFSTFFFTYWMVSFYLQSFPFTASRGVALKVFLYLRIMPLSGGNIWVMDFFVVGTEV